MKRFAIGAALVASGLAAQTQIAPESSLDAVMKKGVLRANPGGSNERFAKANFKTATLTIHGENLTIFDQILAKRADVFVHLAKATGEYLRTTDKWLK